MYGMVTLHLPIIACLKSYVHHIVGKILEEIPVVREYQDVFLEELLGRSPNRDVELEIELAKFKIQLKKFLDNGYIRPSFSLWGCPTLFVKKKNQGLQLCVDYRSLNAITIKNTCPLSSIDILFDYLAHAQMFSKIDLHSSHPQIKICTEDIPKTTFSTRYGLYEYFAMSFELTNAPAQFMYLMNSVFMSELAKFVMVLLMTFWFTI
jgi:hypothetical protein